MKPKPRLKTLAPRVSLLQPPRLPVATATVERQRGRAGVEARRRVLRRDFGLCVVCLRAGRTTPAEEVDHVTPLWKGGADSDENKQSLCRTCHDAKSAAEAKERG